MSSATIGSLRCCSHSSSRVILLPKMLSLRSRSYKSSPLSCPLHPPKCSRFLISVWLPYSRCPTHFSVVIVQVLPFAAFTSFVDRLAKGMPVSVYQGQSPSFLRNVINIDTGFLGANFLCSQRQLHTLGSHSSDFGPRTSKDLTPSFRWSTSNGLSNFITVSPALHNSFSASLTKDCYNSLDWAISIFLLSRQQLERIDLHTDLALPHAALKTFA